MLWEELTAPEFKKAAKETGVCVIAMGVLEKHGDHLPLGTDMLVGQQVATLAAQKEPSVVFPPFYFGQIYEARCFPGAFTIKPSLLIELVTAVFDEIGRNGFKKIVVHNAHGGNWNLINFLAQATLWEEKPYSVYVQKNWLTPERKEKWNALLETKEHGHACECETSILMACHPKYAKMEKVPKKPATNLQRIPHLKDAFTGINWYAAYPEHYAGNANFANAKKGKKLLQLLVDTLAEFIAVVKEDKVVPTLNSEFYERVKKLNK